ncbi:MAG: hypothetical protein QMD65_00950 [Patescibacteria group bacterium]|nr:hypothetical protein [Patescibacteria group bacterium]
MKTSIRREQKKRVFFDIQNDKPKDWWLSWISSRKTLNLKKRFYERRPLIALFIVLLIGGGVFVLRSALTKAEVADFYPGSCLGTWQSPQNAQGMPETFNSSELILDENNSAVFSSGTEKIFCGSFVPDSYESKGDLKNVGLTLVWRVEDLTSSSSDAQFAPATSTLENIPENISTSTEEELKPQSFLRYLFNFAFARLPSPTAQATDGQAEESNESAEDLTIQATTTEVMVPVLESTTTADVLGVSTSTTTETTTIIIAPPIIAPLGPISSSSDVILFETSTVTSTATTTALEVIELIIDENFIRVSFSLNGYDWFELGRVNLKNWSSFTATLPVKTWDELKTLQISIEGMPTILTNMPRIFLDGMFVEARFELPPALDTIISLMPKSDEQAVKIVLPAAEFPKPSIQIFDPEARHSCRVEPFSVTIKRGGEAQYSILLTSFDDDAAYELLTGDLPSGVSASISPMAGRETSSSSSAYFTVAEEAQQGSFNIVVIYREENKDNRFIPNFCQLNLIIE